MVRGLSIKYRVRAYDEAGREYSFGVWIREHRVQFGGPYSQRHEILSELRELGFLSEAFEPYTKHGDASKARVKYRVLVDRTNGEHLAALTRLALFLKTHAVEVTSFRRLMN